jgi:lysophospholipase L1-like esterase
VTRRVRRLALIVVVNIVVFLFLFIPLEIAYRIHVDGFSVAWINLANEFRGTPYSNLGTHNWMIGDDVLGFRLNPDRKGINRLSIRDHEIATPKPPGLFRAIFLGDSIPYAFPGFVSYTGEALGHQGDIEVLNAGVPGYTTYQELMFLKLHLMVAAPDLVILTYCLNDNYKFLHRFDSRGQMLFTQEASEALKIHSSLDVLLSHSYVLTRLKLGLALAIRPESKFPWDSREGFSAAWQDESWKANEQYLAEMSRTLAEHKIRFAIVIFPFEPQLREDLLRADFNYVVKPQQKLIAICDRYHVPCLDLLPVFRKQYATGAKFFLDGIHLNEQGHRTVTVEILQFLRAQPGWLPSLH